MKARLYVTVYDTDDCWDALAEVYQSKGLAGLVDHIKTEYPYLIYNDPYVEDTDGEVQEEENGFVLTWEDGIGEVMRIYQKVDKDMEREVLRDEIAESILDSNLDILDIFNSEEIADKVMEIAGALESSPSAEVSMVHGTYEYQIKVNNNMNGFVSVSDSFSTGVSRTLYKPYYVDDDGELEGLINMASMINEAWYKLKECKI